MKFGLKHSSSALAITSVLIVLLAGPSLAVLPAFSGDLYSNSSPVGILGTGYWVTTGPVHLHWDVNQEISGIWDYSYTLTVPDGNISHLILECSPGLTANDLSSLTGTFSDIVIDDYTSTSQGNSNPNLPGLIHGIKFENVNTTTGSFSFKTFRDPVWGDFYAKDGNAHNPQGVTNTAWNAEFSPDGVIPDDPTDPPSNGSVHHHVLVPDTTQPVPDASTVVLACFGALPLLAMRRRGHR